MQLHRHKHVYMNTKFITCNSQPLWRGENLARLIWVPCSYFDNVSVIFMVPLQWGVTGTQHPYLVTAADWAEVVKSFEKKLALLTIINTPCNSSMHNASHWHTMPVTDTPHKSLALHTKVIDTPCKSQTLYTRVTDTPRKSLQALSFEESDCSRSP